MRAIHRDFGPKNGESSFACRLLKCHGCITGLVNHHHTASDFEDEHHDVRAVAEVVVTVGERVLSPR